MNKKAYRLIFSKSRGMLVAVAEIVVGHVKGSTPAKAPQVIGIDSVYTFFPVKAISLSACLMLGSVLQLVSTQTQAQNLPTGGQVVGGAASIAQPNANKMEITQTTSKAVINWNTFNVGAGNTVQFIQPSSNSQVLNRVVGINGGSSQILGTLTANGQVFIVNPQGIVFGNGSMVNVGALLASTRDISPNAFMAGGNLQFSTDTNASGLISNAGSLNASSGFVVLAADQIRNTGSINAPGGQVILTAGDQATLSLSNGQLVQFTVNQNANNLAIASNGVIQAQDGKIVLNANATNSLLNSVINLSGVVSASGGTVAIDAGANGKVNLDTATVDVSRQGGLAGNITMSAQEIAVANTRLLAGGANGKGGTIILSGNPYKNPSQVTVEDSTIDVSARNSGSVDSPSNTDSKGGTVILAGNRVGVFGNSTIHASGINDGGAVIIGGDQLGKVGLLMPVPLANQTYIGNNSTILIGSSAGDGGFVETSGQTLTMLGNVKGSSKGKNGEWLIDPTNITINAVASTNVTNTSNVWAGGTNATGTVLNTSITNALANGTSVTVTTNSSGAAEGNLTVAADLVVTNPQNSTLTLFANQSLTFNGVNVCATGTGTLGLIATAANGTLTINGTSFNLNGGTANLSGDGSVRNLNGVSITGNVALNGNDRINITGSSVGALQGVSQTGNLTQVNGITNISGNNRDGAGDGVRITGNISQNSGTLNIDGTNTNSTGMGVRWNGTNATTGLAYLNQTGGSINITGNSIGTSNASHGVNLNYVSLNQINGTMNITGSSNAANGLLIENSSLTINSSLNLNGTSIGSNINFPGLRLLSGSITQSNGSVSINGDSNVSAGVSHENLIITQNNGSMNVVGSSISNSGVIGGSANLIQNNGSMNITARSNSTVGYSAANQIITQNAGSMNITATSNSPRRDDHGMRLGAINQLGGNMNITSNSANSHALVTYGNINQANGTMNITGTSRTYQGIYVKEGTSISQTSGSLNITGTSDTFFGVSVRTNLTQNGGTLNITGTSNTNYGMVLNLTGNLTQTNGSLNMTGSSSSSDGVLLLGNITQTNGSLNISTVVGNLNQSANMSIGNNLQLLAGTGSAAGNTGGGNVTLGRNISASNNATLAIFSGSPNTAAYQTNITGANSTGVYYKTYNASAANVSPISATQNFYYRSAPSLNITTNNKVYDATINASSLVSGSVDGDSLSANGITFKNPNPGLQLLNTSALVVSNTNSSWTIGGYSIGNVSSSAEIFPDSDSQTVLAASSSLGFILQGSSSASNLSKADSVPSSSPSSASSSSQGSLGSSTKDDQKSSTASASTRTVSVSLTPGGDVPIPAVSIIALAD